MPLLADGKGDVRAPGSTRPLVSSSTRIEAYTQPISAAVRSSAVPSAAGRVPRQEEEEPRYVALAFDDLDAS